MGWIGSSKIILEQNGVGIRILGSVVILKGWVYLGVWIGILVLRIDGMGRRFRVPNLVI